MTGPRESIGRHPRRVRPDAAIASEDAADSPHAPAPSPRVVRLGPRECDRVLHRNSVGRIAFAFDRRVEILPIHYVPDGEWLYGRTSPGDKLAMWHHSHWVAFEVDEVRGLFDWTSVVVHGGLDVLDPSTSARAAAAWEHAIALLRRLVPDTGTVHDPVPNRTIVFRIHVDEVSGRSALPPPPVA